MAPPRKILDFMSLEQVKELVEYHLGAHCQVDEVTGCCLYTGAVNGSGYPLVKTVPRLAPPQDQVSTGFLLHRIALVLRLGVDIVHEASHLCGIRLCFNPEHLEDEPHNVNESRKGCPGVIVCAQHSHVIGNFCVHPRVCIRRPRDDINCCLVAMESDPENWALQQGGNPVVKALSVGDEPGMSSQSSLRRLNPIPVSQEVIDLISSSSSPRQPSGAELAPSSNNPRSSAALLPLLPHRRNSDGLDLPPLPSRRLHTQVSIEGLLGDVDLSHNKPSSPLAPEPKRRSAVFLGASDITVPSSDFRQQLTSDEASPSPELPTRRGSGRPEFVPSTQARQTIENYFEEDEDNDPHYAAAAARLRDESESTSSFREDSDD